MTPAEALDAANQSAAELLRMEGEIGTVEAGKMVDLVVLDSDPLENISALRELRMVIKGGKLA
jgi:imidazolonepropionase-like amidohydrolase